MLNELFAGLFDTTTTVSLTVTDLLICLGVALMLGIFMAKLYAFHTKCTKGFAVTLALLPAVISMVIIMVNGNIGAGVAVAGAFSLVRFRSVPGTAKEIASIFMAMCTGLTLGMGYIAFAVLFAVIVCIFWLVINKINFVKTEDGSRSLHITIPENLNYSQVFDDIFEQYTKKAKLITVKTTNMGSLFKLSYEIELKDTAQEKEFMDTLRCRNGNLEIVITSASIMSYEL